MKRVLITLIMMLTFTLGYTQETTTAPEPSFEQIIKPYVQKALDVVETGAQFVMDETPIVIQQYVMFEATRLWAIVLLGFLFITLIRYWATGQVLTKSSANKKPEGTKSYHDYIYKGFGRWLKVDTDKNDYSLHQVWYYILNYSSIIAGSIIIIANIISAIKVTFFPKLYLVEKFIYLVS